MSMGGMTGWWGPVFDAERVTRARRWQGYALRSLFVLGLLVGMGLVFLESRQGDGGPVTAQELAGRGSSVYYLLTFLEQVAVLLIAPAATAGAICLDKSRGSLAHVFVTDLSNREIILGKLAARLFPVWGLLACALPVAALASWLGGIDPVALTSAFVIVAGLAVLGCALALMLSVWASKPHEVISAVFGVWVIWLLGALLSQLYYQSNRAPFWFERTNPFYLVNAPYDHPGETSLLEPVLFGLVCVLLGGIFTAVAIAKVRVVGCRSSRVPTRRVGLIGRFRAWVQSQVRWGRGPTLDRNPVLWREWHRNRPSRWSRVVWGGFKTLGVLLCGSFLISAWVDSSRIDEETGPIFLGLLTTLGLLLISTSTASVLAEERSRGSLDILISTPLTTRAILTAKWRGAFRRVPGLTFWPIVLAGRFAFESRLEFVSVAILYLVPILIVAQGAALVSLGLALATWIKRTSVATAWTVGLAVATIVGWPILGSFLELGASSAVYNGVLVYPGLRAVVLNYLLILGSPFLNVALPLILGVDSDGQRQNTAESQAMLILVVGWTLVYGLVAWGLFEATVRTFDRSLGRMPERPSAPRLAPKERSRLGIKGMIGKMPTPGRRSVARAASVD